MSRSRRTVVGVGHAEHEVTGPAPSPVPLILSDLASPTAQAPPTSPGLQRLQPKKRELQTLSGPGEQEPEDQLSLDYAVLPELTGKAP